MNSFISLVWLLPVIYFLFEVFENGIFSDFFLSLFITSIWKRYWVLYADFGILWICWKCLVGVRVSLVESFRVFKYKIVSSSKRENQTFSFLCVSHLILSLAALYKNSNSIFSKSKFPLPFLNFKGNSFSFPPLVWDWVYAYYI
jgi:hypothetical protein